MMEDNTQFIAGRIWNRIFPPAFIGDFIVLLMFQFGIFFLVSRYCGPGDLILYSAFLPFWYLYSTFDCFFAFAASQLFSIYKGAGNNTRAQRVFAETLTTLLLLFITGYLIAFWRMRGIVNFLNIPSEYHELAVLYGRLMVLSGCVDCTANFLREFLRSDSQPKKAAVIGMTGVITFFICACVFIGVLHHSVIAIPVMMLIAEVLGIVVYLLCFLSEESTIKIRLGWISWKTIKEIFLLSCGNLIICGVAFVIETLTVRWVLLRFGGGTVTILALTSLLFTCSYSFGKSFIGSVQSLTGVFRGEQNANGIRCVFRKGILGGAAVQFTIGILTVIFAEQIADFMQVNGGNFEGETAWALRLTSIAIFLRFFYYFFCGFYNVCGFSKMVAFCSMTANGVSYMSWLAVFVFVIGDEKIFWGVFPTIWSFNILFVAAVILFVKYKGKYRSFLLLSPLMRQDLSYHFLLNGQEEEFQDYRTMFEMFLQKQNIGSNLMTHCHYVFEELYLFAKEKNAGRRKSFFSLVISVFQDRLEFALRYDSSESCLHSILNGERRNLPPEQLAGAKLLKKFSDNMYIDRIYGFNFVRLTVNRQ